MRMSRKPGHVERRLELLTELSDGVRSSREIQAMMSEMLGYQCTHSYVVNAALKHNLPRLPQVNKRYGVSAPSWKHGRRINSAGYAVVKAPKNHPTARKNGTILEHRLVVEQTLSRPLQTEEVVDHIDGLTLHNDPANLRLFSSSAEHLRHTISGQTPKWSPAGFQNVVRGDLQLSGNERIDTSRQSRASGDYRLRQCILIVLKFGIDSPFALGTLHHLEKAQIDYSSRSNLRRALDRLYRKWGWDPAP